MQAKSKECEEGSEHNLPPRVHPREKHQYLVPRYSGPGKLKENHKLHRRKNNYGLLSVDWIQQLKG